VTPDDGGAPAYPSDHDNNDDYDDLSVLVVWRNPPESIYGYTHTA
jgi:hypothetical protein